MTHFSLPRYFVGHSDTTEENTIETPALHVIDSFFVGNRHLEEREWIVTVDGNGSLRALPRENRESYPEALQNELVFNEISRSSRSSRLIEATEIFLFNLQVVEQAAAGSAPGWNDPVYLYGTLYEFSPPYADKPSAGVKGQLTATRGDVLDGLAGGADYAFRYNGFGGAAGSFSKCFQMMLPGDTEAEIRRGAGVILAYPLFPAELLTTDAANEIIVSQLVYDLLTGLKEDLTRERINHPLVSAAALPVPNRNELEQNLKSEGYTITGDTAVKRADSTEGFKGLLASVFGSLVSDDLTLPPEGKAEDFIRLARETVRHLPNDFPSPRIVALRNCLKTAPANNRRGYQPPTPHTINIPQNSTQQLPPTPPSPARAKTRKRASSNQPPAWMRDFISAHRQTNDAPPTLTSTLQMKPPIIRAAKPESQEQKKDDWLKDFEPTAQAQAKSDAPKKDSPDEPDWMKDFD